MFGREVEGCGKLNGADRLLRVAGRLGAVRVGNAFLTHYSRCSGKIAVTIEVPGQDRHEIFGIGALRRAPVRLELS